MKVVHLSTSTDGGAGTAAYRIHTALLSNSIDSIFLSMHISKTKSNSSTHKIERQKLNKYGRLKNKFWRSLSRFGCSHNACKKYFLEYEFERQKKLLNCEIASLPFSEVNLLTNPIIADADIVHLHWVAGMLDYPSFFKRIEKPIVWTCHDLNPFLGLYHYRGDEIRNDTTSKKMNEDLILTKEKVIKQRRSRMISVCPSPWLQTELSASKVFSSVQSHTIFNPVDFNIFCSRESTSLRKEMNIPDGHTVFLFVAQSVSNYRKGFDLLKTALENLNSDNVTLLIIGEAEELNLNGPNIYYLGIIENEVELSYYYSMADAFIIPSREDNLPNVMLEALACGTPVISFNIGGMKDIIIDGVNGLKVAQLESRSLAASLDLFMETKSTFNRDSIRRLAYEMFESKSVAKKYINLYNRLLFQENNGS